MKMLIAGSRSIVNFDLSPYITADVDTIISGGADGIDSLAVQYADLHRGNKVMCYIRKQHQKVTKEEIRTNILTNDLIHKYDRKPTRKFVTRELVFCIVLRRLCYNYQ